MANIQITDYEAFAKEFIEEYLSRGLGAPHRGYCQSLLKCYTP